MTSAAGAIIEDRTAPTVIATTATPTPSRRCTRSRSTNAIPIMVTPEGAIRPGATGMRQGPFGTHSVPAWPISQFAAGMVRPNRMRHTTPSTRRRLSFVCSLGCIIVSPYRLALSSCLPSRKSIGPQPAGRAAPAAIAPVVAPRAVAQIAGVGLLDQEIDEILAGNLVPERKGRRLVDEHQRRMDDEAALHAEIERQLHRLHGVVAAIGIAGKVGLAHAGDQVPGATPIGERARKRQEDQVT